MLYSGAVGPLVARHAVNSVADWPSQTRGSSSLSMSRTGASIDALLDDWLSSYTDCSSDDCDGFIETDVPAHRPPSFAAPVAMALTALQEGEGTYDPRETSSSNPTTGGAEPGAVPGHAAAALTAVGPSPLDGLGFLRPCDTGSSSTPRTNQVLSSATCGPSDGGASTHTTSTVVAAEAATRYEMYDTPGLAADSPMEISTPARSAADVHNPRGVTAAAAAAIVGRCATGCRVGAAAAGDAMYPSNLAGATTFVPKGLAASWNGAQHRLSSVSDEPAHLALLAAAGQLSWRWSWPAMSPQPSAKKHPRQPAGPLEQPYPLAAVLHRGQQQQQPQEQQQPCVYGGSGAPSRTDAGVCGCGGSDPAGRKAAPRRLLAPPLRWPEGAFDCPRLSAPTAGARHSCPPGPTDMREFEDMMAWISQAAWREGPSDPATASPLAAQAAVDSCARNPPLLWAGDTRNSQYVCPSEAPLVPTAAVAAPPAAPGYSAAEPQAWSPLHSQSALGLAHPATAGAQPPEWGCALGEPWAGAVFPQPTGPWLRPPRSDDDGIAYGACPGRAQPKGTAPTRLLLPPRSEQRGQRQVGPQGLSSKLWSHIQQVEGASTAPWAAPATRGSVHPSPPPQLALPRQVGSAAARELQVGWESGAPPGEARAFLPGARQPEVHSATDGTVTWAPCGLIAIGIPASKRACLCCPCEHA